MFESKNYNRTVMRSAVLFVLFCLTQGKQCPTRTFIEQSLIDVHVPGAVIMVVNKTDILYQEAFGYESFSPEKPMNVDQSVFVLASISKTFISTAVMQLVESKRLDLDTDINEYLSRAKQRISHPDYPCNPITLRHLLSHTASIGLDNVIGLSGLKMGDEGFTDDLTLADALISHFNRNDPNWLPKPPGTVFLYSNIGTSLAAAVVEQVAQIPYTIYIKEKILKPLGIDVKNSGFRLTDIENRENLVKHYIFNSSSLPLWQEQLPQINVSQTSSPNWLSIPFYSMDTFAAGLLRMSTKSLSIFLRMFMNDGFPLLNSNSIREMRHIVDGIVPYNNVTREDNDWQPLPFGFGLIWIWGTTTNGRRFIGHGGTILGASHSMLVNEDGTLGVIILTMADVFSDEQSAKLFGRKFAEIRMSFFECFEK